MGLLVVCTGVHLPKAGLLQLAGFEFRDPSFIFPIEKGLDEAERVRDLLQEALRDSDRRWAEACGVTDSVEVPGQGRV